MNVSAPRGVSWAHWGVCSQLAGWLGLAAPGWPHFCGGAWGQLGLTLSTQFFPPGSSQGSSLPKRRAEAARSWRPEWRSIHQNTNPTSNKPSCPRFGEGADSLWPYLIYQARHCLRSKEMERRPSHGGSWNLAKKPQRWAGQGQGLDDRHGEVSMATPINLP